MSTSFSPQKTVKQFRLVGILEAISYLVLLFFAMPMKYIYNEPFWVQKFGMLHGWLFVLYMVLLFLVKYQSSISWRLTLWLFVLSIIPFGTFYADRKYLSGFVA